LSDELWHDSLIIDDDNNDNADVSYNDTVDIYTCNIISYYVNIIL